MAGIYAAIVALVLYVQYNLIAGLLAYYALYHYHERHGYRDASRRAFYLEPIPGEGVRRVVVIQ